jgi:hypothetical protein
LLSYEVFPLEACELILRRKPRYQTIRQLYPGLSLCPRS